MGRCVGLFAAPLVSSGSGIAGGGRRVGGGRWRRRRRGGGGSDALWMGKPIGGDDQQGLDDPGSGAEGRGGLFCGCSRGLRRIRNAFSCRCVVLLLLSAGVLLSAVFWLPPLRGLGSGPDSGDGEDFSGERPSLFLRLTRLRSGLGFFPLLGILSSGMEGRDAINLPSPTGPGLQPARVWEEFRGRARRRRGRSVFPPSLLSSSCSHFTISSKT